MKSLYHNQIFNITRLDIYSRGLTGICSLFNITDIIICELNCKIKLYNKKIDVKIIIKVICFYLRRALTTALTLRLRRSVYVCPVPTKTIGCPVVYVIEMAAPTYKNNEDIVTDCLVIHFHFVNFQQFLSYLS